MIKGWLGLAGSGKSADMTRTGSMELKVGRLIYGDKFRVYANYELTKGFGDYAYLEGSEWWNIDRDNPGLVLVDEAQEVAESRDFHNKQNISFVHWVSQIRKYHKDLRYTVRLGSEVDKRLRLQTDFIVICKSIPPAPFVYNPHYRPQLFVYEVFKPDAQGEFTKKVYAYQVSFSRLEATVFPLYNSYHVVEQKAK